MKPEAVELLISGLPLLNPHVGVGVHTLRLIHGLLRRSPIPAFQVLLPAAAAEAATGIPSEFIIPIPCPTQIPHPLLATQILAQRITRCACRDFPNAVFHSPGPLWSPWQPRNTVVTLHDCLYRRFPRYLGRWGIRKMLTLAAERYGAQARRVLTVSHFSAGDLAELARIPARKIEVLYNWVDDAFDARQARAAAEAVRQRYPLPVRFWLYVGGFDYRKNVEFLLQSYAAARQSGPLPNLVLAGKIPDHTHPTLCDVEGTLRQTGLEDGAVLRIGPVAAADLPGLYAAAELFIYPSLYEGFGLPAAEAEAVGTPLLVANTSSLPEVVTNPACRFDPTRLPELVSKLLGANQHPAQFISPLRPEFRESYAIPRYLEILAPLLASRS